MVCNYQNQWRIQDFPFWVPTPNAPTFLKELYAKTKESEPSGGTSRQRPLALPMKTAWFSKCDAIRCCKLLRKGLVPLMSCFLIGVSYFLIHSNGHWLPINHSYCSIQMKIYIQGLVGRSDNQNGIL